MFRVAEMPPPAPAVKAHNQWNNDNFRYFRPALQDHRQTFSCRNRPCSNACMTGRFWTRPEPKSMIWLPDHGRTRSSRPEIRVDFIALSNKINPTTDPYRGLPEMDKSNLKSSACYLRDRRGRVSGTVRINFVLSDLTSATAQLENLVRTKVGKRACPISPKRMPPLHSMPPQICRCVPVWL